MSDCISYCRAAHAAPTTPAPAQFRAGYGQYLYAGRFQGGIGIVVAVVTDNDARAQCQHVIAIVPLFPLPFGRGLATSGDHFQRRVTKDLRNNIKQRATVLEKRQVLVAFSRTQVVANHFIGDFLERGDYVAATEGKHRIQVHG